MPKLSQLERGSIRAWRRPGLMLGSEVTVLWELGEGYKAVAPRRLHQAAGR